MATYEYGMTLVQGDTALIVFTTVPEADEGDNIVMVMNDIGAAGWEMVEILTINDQLATVSDNYMIFWKKTTV